MSKRTSAFGRWHDTDRPGWRRAVVRRLIATASCLVLALPIGCSKPTTLERPRATRPPPTFTGPPFLHGTIGSLTRIRGNRPLLVSSHGVVAELDGTGSSDVPPYLRQSLMNEMRLRGLQSARLGTQHLTPERFLNSDGTTVVLVEGLIPPGAVKGSRFDVLVTTAQPQTTSLDGGRLWTTNMGVEGANPAIRHTRQQANARGPIYLNPFSDDQQNPLIPSPVVARGVVLAGGVVTANRSLELMLNQPDYQRSRIIANRINERFPKGMGDRYRTADPKSDGIIRLHVPSRFAQNPGRLLALISHLYIQRAPYFAYEQSKLLADLLVKQPRWADHITLAWESIGNPALPTLQRFYDRDNETLTLRLAALSAGARLEDARTIDHFIELADHQDHAVRQRVATELVHLPKSIRGSTLLQKLLNDANHRVRLAAYESLAGMSDPIVERRVFGRRETFKFILDLVPSSRPMIYLSQVDMPRVVVFGPNTGFKKPILASIWDKRLMLKDGGPNQPVSVFYQPAGESQPKINQIAPAVANLVFLMAHKQTVADPTPGLDLPFGKVAHALYQLSKDDKIEGELKMDVNPLATAIEQSRITSHGEMRPETAAQATTTGLTPLLPTAPGSPGSPVSPLGSIAVDPSQTTQPIASPSRPFPQLSP